MSDSDRRDPANGIWACAHHGKLIDADDSTYTVEALRTWKALAMRRAQLSQMLARPAILSVDDPDLNNLAPIGLRIKKLAGSRKAILELFVESAVSVAWGEELAAATRDLVIEILGNALSHGGASDATITVEPRRFIIWDNGTPFDSRSLPDHPNARGGADAMRAIKGFSGRLIIDYHRNSQGNRTTIAAVKSRADLMMATNCFVDTDVVLAGDGAREEELGRVAACDVVYVFPPDGLTYSDRGDVVRAAAEIKGRGKHAVVVVEGYTSAGVIKMIQQNLHDFATIQISGDNAQFRRPEVVQILDLREADIRRLTGESGDYPPFMRL